MRFRADLIGTTKVEYQATSPLTIDNSYRAALVVRRPRKATISKLNNDPDTVQGLTTHFLQNALPIGAATGTSLHVQGTRIVNGWVTAEFRCIDWSSKTAKAEVQFIRDQAVAFVPTTLGLATTQAYLEGWLSAVSTILARGYRAFLPSEFVEVRVLDSAHSTEHEFSKALLQNLPYVSVFSARKRIERQLADQPEGTHIDALDRTFLRAHDGAGVIANGGLKYFFEGDWPNKPPYAEFVDAFSAVGAHRLAKALDETLQGMCLEEPHLHREHRRAEVETMNLPAIAEDAENIQSRLDEFIAENRAHFAR